MLLEDVVCPVENLAGMTTDLQEMFERNGYKGASMFGHALEGNLHLVFSQGFRDAAEVERFDKVIEEMCWIVATKHSGSLKVGLSDLCNYFQLRIHVFCIYVLCNIVYLSKI